MSSALQVSGEPKYLDDIAPFHNELQGAFVVSTEPHARITNIDYKKAKSMPGVYQIVTREDVSGENAIGTIVHDELCFAGDIVTTVRQVIALVIADTLEHAKAAAKAVHFKYKRLPAIVTIEEAI